MVVICITAITKSHDHVAGLHFDRIFLNPEQKAVFSPQAIKSRLKQADEAEERHNIDQQDRSLSHHNTFFLV